ncbi:MAG: PilZ domain-containing protein [Myxococcota bacterium]|nr:PilZ domain-containing protein [Myxococcota bacterium]
MSDEGRSLRVAFESEESFRREYQANIANGGIFIATNVGFTAREVVRVEIALEYCDERIELEGEIVHVVASGLAGTGAIPGVAVQFDLRASDLRECFRSVLGKGVSEDERESGAGRRTTRRAPARIPVVIRTSDGTEVEGRSRDLSLSSVLVAISPVAVSIADTVELVLTNPITDEELDLEGTVMRHIAGPNGQGIVLGIRFEVPSHDQGVVEAFIKDIQVAEHSRRLGGISGPISEIGIENLLQMFGTCAPEGTLNLMRADEEGFIMFEQGMLRSARLAESYGRKALGRLLGWRDGTFEFHARVDAEAFQGDPIPLDAAMLDALCLLDESQRSDVPPIPLTSRLRVDLDKVNAARGELSQSEEAVVDLASVGMSVSKVIDVIPKPDEEIRQQIAGLLARGLIRLVD